MMYLSTLENLPMHFPHRLRQKIFHPHYLPN
jgi:hypothetical protein